MFILIKVLLAAAWVAFLSYGIYRAVAVDPEWTVIWYWLGLTIFAVTCWVLGALVWPLVRPYAAVAGEHLDRFNVCSRCFSALMHAVQLRESDLHARTCSASTHTYGSQQSRAEIAHHRCAHVNSTCAHDLNRARTHTPPPPLQEKRYAIFVWAGLIAAYVFGTAFMSGLGDPVRFASLAGYIVYLLILWVCSHNRSHISWRPVVCGLLTQFSLALLIMKT